MICVVDDISVEVTQNRETPMLILGEIWEYGEVLTYR